MSGRLIHPAEMSLWPPENRERKGNEMADGPITQNVCRRAGEVGLGTLESACRWLMLSI